MSMQDPVADMLTRIRNAQMMGIQKIKCLIQNSKVKFLKFYKKKASLKTLKLLEMIIKKTINVTLKYYQGKPVIEKIKRISRPALRIYRGREELPLVRGGLGIAIVSTPKGVMADKTARAQTSGW